MARGNTAMKDAKQYKTNTRYKAQSPLQHRYSFAPKVALLSKSGNFGIAFMGCAAAFAVWFTAIAKTAAAIQL